MMFLPYLFSSVPEDEATRPLIIAKPEAKPGREPLRHLIIGSRQGVRSAINTLQVLNYADQSTWSQLIAIPESGIVLTPEQGEVLSYLIRDRPLG